MSSDRSREVKLRLWQEIVGDCIKLSFEGKNVAIHLFVHGEKLKIVYPCRSGEGFILRRLGGKLVGRKIGILRTDDPARPIVVRIVGKGSLGDINHEGDW